MYPKIKIAYLDLNVIIKVGLLMFLQHGLIKIDVSTSLAQLLTHKKERFASNIPSNETTELG